MSYSCQLSYLLFNNNSGISLKPGKFYSLLMEETSRLCSLSEGMAQWLFCGCLVAKLCRTLWDSMDYSLPASSICRILQARILDWFAISFSSGSTQDQTCVSCVGK